MGARTAPGWPQDGGRSTRSWPGLSRAVSRIPSLFARLPRPSPYAAALAAALIAIAFVAGLTYYGAREFSGRAANRRAAEEAQSLAAHSSLLATGDAYTAYLQMLRYADDPLVHEKTTPREQRTAALQQLVYLNTNMFQSLTVADRGGNVLATTDRSIHDMRPSQAFTRTRANLGPTNSDIVLPEPGKPGYVDFGTPLKDAEGSTWAFLIGRAEPSRLWRATLRATVDASRNVIINSNGEFSTGVPNELLGQPWRGVPLENGSVRADIAGVDSICGLGAIGKDTQIDHGWNVASCLPVSLIQAQHGTAIGKQAQVTLAGAVLAAVLAAGLMRAGVRERKPLLMLPAPAAAAEAAAAAPAGAPASDVTPGQHPERAPAPQPPPIVADVDALALIEAYEERAARLAARLRESVKARLLVAATQADEAYRLVTADAELAATLHARAMEELEGLRERDLRAIGQELHPGMVRLGLPAALKALRKDLIDVVQITLDVDPAADAVSPSRERVPIDEPRRLLLYRLALDGARAIASAGASECVLTLRRGAHVVTLALEGRIDAEATFDDTDLAPGRIAAEAYGGTVTCHAGNGRASIHVELPAPHQGPGGAPGRAADDDPAESETFEGGPMDGVDVRPADEEALEPGRALSLDDEPLPASLRDLEDADDEPEDEDDDGPPLPLRIYTVSLTPDIEAGEEEQDPATEGGAEPVLPSNVHTFSLETEEPKIVEAHVPGAPFDDEPEAPKLRQLADDEEERGEAQSA